MKKMDEIAKKGYEEFKEYYLHVAKLYQTYGECILNVEFDGLELNFKEQFKKYADARDKFGIVQMLQDIWMKEYQDSKIIKSAKDITNSLYTRYQTTNQKWINTFSAEDKTKYYLSEFAIDQDYFYELNEKKVTMKRDDEFIYVVLQENEDDIYIIELSNKGHCVKILGYYPKNKI